MTELMKIGNALKAANEGYVPDYMNMFKLGCADLQKGVRCPKCHRYYMKREGLKWRCMTCSFQSYKAHEKALKEYTELIASTISNKEARDFLQVKSRHVIYRLLSNYAKEMIGEGRSLRYKLK